MATKMYTDNYGVQAGAAYPLMMNHTDISGGTSPDDDIGPVAIPVGYDIEGTQTGVTDNGDGTFTLVGGTYAGAPISFTPSGSVAHEVTDSAGVAIDANTVDQSSL